MPKPKRHRRIPLKPTFKIFCEGEKTEPEYIQRYIDHFHSEKRSILLVKKTEINTPVQLVELAIESKKTGHKNDVIWVVYDREAENKYSHQLHAQARRKAKAEGIEIAFSNICFEVWILLYFEYSTGPYHSCSDLLKRSRLKEHIKKLGFKNYEKSLPLLFDKVKHLVPAAIRNAERLKTYAENFSERGKSYPHYLNPYVDVQEMFQDMKNFTENLPRIRK